MSAQGSHLGTRGLKSAAAGMSLGGGHVGSDWSGGYYRCKGWNN